MTKAQAEDLTDFLNEQGMKHAIAVEWDDHTWGVECYVNGLLMFSLYEWENARDTGVGAGLGERLDRYRPATERTWKGGINE